MKQKLVAACTGLQQVCDFVRRLARWSRKWPRDVEVLLSREPECKAELFAIEDEAMRLCPEGKGD